ncbi:TIGR04282 family arsenosugar biosynthesis glycosyltransferase [Pseudomonas sp. N040]|uniref:TIGR04282 family arsenosugar biosynthesis glycosyltransferase n=1 Tax=Pseudomonas sp. N040 TaxID=2785325 RepID=UPI001C614BB9|nr:DUF2064 domain-containing protein [Pseudomonas sp. N040]MBW7012804.1 DUF2064 domain-containing protein [Pseudomonas sp. N040]
MTASHSRDTATVITPCLVLLCKHPAPGHSKQRLASQIGRLPALTIARLLLDCALEDLRQWPGARVIAPDQAHDLAWAQAVCPPAWVLAQGEGNLGQRLNALDRALRARGEQRLLYIGSDCPALRPADYARVAQLLESCDSVLLGARDGGVVLLASNRPWPDLSQLPWSTAQLGEALAACCVAAGHSLHVAGELFDIDQQEDLALLGDGLAGDNRPARRALLAALPALGIAAHA